MNKVVVSRVRIEDVGAAVRALGEAGIPERDLSILCPDSEVLDGAYGTREESQGRLMSATSLIVTEIGPCVVSGPVAQMLVGTPGGRLVSGLTISLPDLVHLIGVAARDRSALPMFEAQLRDGDGVILVHYRDTDQKARARSVLDGLGGTGASGKSARASSGSHDTH